MKVCQQLSFILMALSLASCVTPPSFDYASFNQHRPRSILVLPPLNETTDVNAGYNYLSTISRPIGECGFYVFPVAVIDALMKENGLPSATEMHAVSLNKIDEIIGADAVLYVTIEDWGQKYIVIQSMTIVKTRFKLVDVKSGKTIWHGQQNFAVGSGSGGGGIAGLLIMAVVDQIIDHLTDRVHDVSRMGNFATTRNIHTGLLAGPYLKNKENENCGKTYQQ